MTKSDGMPCKKCNTNDWGDRGNCKQCARDKSRDWRAKNRDRHREYSRAWQKANPNETNEKNRNWRLKNPEKARASVRNWQRTNPDKVIAKVQRRRTARTQAGGSYTVAEWRELCARYDGHCCYPGCDRTDLQPDHVTPVIMGGSSDISNIQPLCAYHNRSKGAKKADYRTKPGIARWIQKRLL